MGETKSFLHDGTLGDVVAALPAIKECYKKTGKKGILYLTSGKRAVYYEGAVHPTVNDKGENCMLNDGVINMLIPLVKAQEYIHDCRIHKEEKIDISLNVMRETFVNMPNGCISRWQFYTWPDLACDLSKVWLTVPDANKDFAKGKIIITRSERYLNPQINYFFLKKYEKDILFIGTELEYQIFKLRHNLKIKRLKIKNFLELAQAIKQSKFHISNQTMAFQVSTGLKHPRMVELCSFAPNVIPYGENAFDFYAQEACEYYVSFLNGETPKTQFNGLPVPEIKIT
jgi:hypothetical protein